jgi:oligoendopeptidase F
MAANSAEGIRWNLNDLFSSHDDPRIDQTLSDCLVRAEAFSHQFRDRLENPTRLTPEHLLEGLEELESIYEALSRVGCYSGLLYAADTARPEYQDLEQKVEQRGTEIKNLLLFFELEWLKVEDAVAQRLIEDPTLKPYRHYLSSLRRFRPHTLTEPEEKILNEKDNTGRNAFGRLFSEITSSLTFAMEKDGKKEELNLSQILSLLHEPERNLRQRAMDTLYTGLAQHGQVLTFVYDTLIQDHLTMDRLRHYPNPMVQRHLFNEIDGAAVDTMMQVVESNYGLGRDYFKLKAKLLGLPQLALYDQYAPVAKETDLFHTSKPSRLF